MCQDQSRLIYNTTVYITQQFLRRTISGVENAMETHLNFYFGELLLKPDKSTVPDSITSIRWKHGKNKVAEWDKNFGMDIYAAFINRTILDQTTGDKLLDKTFPKPTITSSCNPDKTSCTLTCEGDTTDAEPITYSWKEGEGAWEVIGKQLIVSKSDSGKPTNGYKYTCKLKNTVSGEGEVSEPVGEVFVSGEWTLISVLQSYVLICQ
uniref:Ig-like domain-containing protein n=1 Tax=Hucho hucho TaxID=62062 RepID=A0A4W5P2L9_9TELE